jgi:protein-S-isoprenylcysteine O-methyltransferase Ste14
VPFDLIAALFGVFAFLYSIGYIIPLSPTMSLWHFWLSFVGATLVIMGGAIFWFGARNAKEPWTVGVNSIVFSIAAGLLAFLSVQLWFAFDLARAVLRLSKS